MTERDVPKIPGEPHEPVEPNQELATTGEIAPARRVNQPSRRLDAWARMIDGAIEVARQSGTEIDLGTARSIAYILGDAVGQASHLANYGRSAEGTYEQLRDEYLLLYNDPTTPPEVKEWINWLGTYLVQREGTGSGRQYMNTQLAPDLERLLIKTELYIRGVPHLVHLPASLDSGGIEALSEDLALLSIEQDEALQAFLTLPDVDASTPMLMEAFHETYVGSYSFLVDAVHELAELDGLEEAIDEAVHGRPLPDGAVSIDYPLIEEHLRDAYDVVEWKGRVYVFAK